MLKLKFPDWVIEDLRKSGISEESGKKLKIQTFTAEAAKEVVGRDCGGAYKFPYFTALGADTRFSRYKLLNPVKMQNSNFMRYWQPPKSPPKLYFPPLVDWKKVLKDQTIEIWITEGEKKAASLCALGVPCAAVSGVWAWKSKRQHEALIPEFRALLPRDVVLCFDSDAETNLSIKGALSMLALELERGGGKVRLCTLPNLDDGKTGLDDFIVAKKKHALKELAQLPKEALGLSAAMHALNAELVVVEEQGTVYSLKQEKFFPVETLKKVTYSSTCVEVYDGGGALRKVPVFDNWISWQRRNTTKRLVYAPGKPPILEDSSMNLWKPSVVEPRMKATAPLFTKLLDFLSKSLTPIEKKWWLQWLAYPLQHPGAKLSSAVIMYSHHGGTGKTLLGYTLQKIYGEHNCEEVDQAELHSQFNTWARCRQFIIGAEISGSDKRTDSDKLKHMITRAKIKINEKYQPAYELDDLCNYYLTTNHADAVYIEQADRRYFVVDTTGSPLEQSFYDAYDTFYKSDAGIAAIAGVLMSVDLKGFNPQAAPPKTAAKLAMHEVSGSEVDGIVRDVVRNPAALASLDGTPNKRELFTLEQLQSLIDPSGRISRMQLGKSLRKAGAPQPFRVGEPGTTKVHVVFAITNFEHWQKASHYERANHTFGEILSKQRRAEKVTGQALLKKQKKPAKKK